MKLVLSALSEGCHLTRDSSFIAFHRPPQSDWPSWTCVFQGIYQNLRWVSNDQKCITDDQQNGIAGKTRKHKTQSETPRHAATDTFVDMQLGTGKQKLQ